MGVVNVTPDSFSDGGRFANVTAAVEHALRMVEEGAALIDIGGESTRPGAQAVDAEEEIRRVVPVIEALAARTQAPISVDTSKSAVVTAAIRAGATLINDVRALREPGALEAAADSGAAICLMHMQGEPRTMQSEPVYADVVGEVREFLAAQVHAAEAVGVARERIVLDPGFGFGKTVGHNTQLFRALPALVADGLPVLVGVSRKSMLGALTGREVNDRLPASLAAAVVAAQSGAAIIRVHDVLATRDALAIWQALKGERA